MRTCSNCNKTHGPLKRYMWNTRTKKLDIAESKYGLLCERCAKSLGAWQLVGQGETITIGTSEEAQRVAMSLTDEDIERLEREEKYSSLN